MQCSYRFLTKTSYNNLDMHLLLLPKKHFELFLRKV